MQKLPEPRIRDEFRRELRARLLTEAQTVLVRRDTAWTFGRLLRPALSFAVVGALLAGGAGTAAANSVAGDPAFALKQAVEDLQVNLTFDDVAKVQTLAQIADHRLAELQSVADNTEKAPAASQAYADAVAKFRAAVDALQKAAPADKASEAQDVADSAREKHLPILDELQDRVPAGAKPAIERALEEQEKDTTEESKDHDRTPRPERTAAPRQNETPRPTEHSGDRTDAPRNSGTPRPTGSSDDHD